MAPEGKDNIKGQACLGCKRNGIEEKTYMTSAWYGFSLMCVALAILIYWVIRTLGDHEKRIAALERQVRQDG